MRKPVRLTLAGLAALTLASVAIPARAGSFIQARHVGERHAARHPEHLRHHHAHHGPRASYGAHRPHAVHVWVPVVDSFARHTERDFVRERDFVGTIESDGGVTIVIESAGSDDGTEVITIILR